MSLLCMNGWPCTKGTVLYVASGNGCSSRNKRPDQPRAGVVAFNVGIATYRIQAHLEERMQAHMVDVTTFIQYILHKSGSTEVSLKSNSRVTHHADNPQVN